MFSRDQQLPHWTHICLTVNPFNLSSIRQFAFKVATWEGIWTANCLNKQIRHVFYYTNSLKPKSKEPRLSNVLLCNILFSYSLHEKCDLKTLSWILQIGVDQIIQWRTVFESPMILEIIYLLYIFFIFVNS